jgi:hypothetical protein
MDMWSLLADRMPKDIPLEVLPKLDWADQAPTFQDAQPAIIDAALRRSQRRPSGNWFVFGASTDVRADRPFGTEVGGTEIVAWRDRQGGLHAGPASCPHLGADLSTGKVECGGLICPWHGLRLDGGWTRSAVRLLSMPRSCRSARTVPGWRRSPAWRASASRRM